MKYNDLMLEVQKVQKIAFRFFSTLDFYDNQDIELIKKYWRDNQELNFKKYGSDGFYKSWVGLFGISNIIINIEDQLSRYRVPILNEILSTYCKLGNDSNVLDFGCGTATTSFFIKRISNIVVKNHYLYDVLNLPYDFVSYRIYNELSTPLSQVKDFNTIENNSIDFLFCIDVLEHIKNPSETFINFDSKIKIGGYLTLMSSWGGDCIEHLIEAETDWNKNIEKIGINSRYEKINDFSYIKKSNYE